MTRYQCEHCGKDFKTPDRHYCKMDPELKNCWTCKHLRGWDSDNIYDEYRETPYPDCTADEDTSWNSWDLELIKEVNYHMQCPKWEKGKYDWSKEGDVDLAF